MGLTGLVRVFWLLSAVSADLNPYRGVGNVQSEKIFNPCFFWADSKNPRLLSLAQHWETPAPSAVLSVHAVSTDSFESEFDLRTFDPEGIVFYGDVEEDGSWFVLALRNGRPEIQVNNKHSSIAVSSGDILNDGKWRRIYVKGRDNEISLVVDRKPILNIVILPNVGLESREASVRIAMGGLLINKSSLLIPLRHSLDACIANWDWLHQNTSWLLKKVANTPNIQCPNNIVPGTFFRGIGMAVFKGSDFLNESESSVDWSLRFEAVIRPVKHNGVVMAILTGAHDPLVKLDFSLRNQHEVCK
ncbi:sex hormone-binding globulin [Heptranchias perlo]|uniref:sex hormone-binding globulin n=1 Tax=Heptranchias perlo TaxID=212740 RepID=UPI0035599B93